MNDAKAIAFLLKGMGETRGRIKRLADALGVERPLLSMWHKRGIPNHMRPRVWKLLNKHGANLPLTWALPQRRAIQAGIAKLEVEDEAIGTNGRRRKGAK